MAKIADKSKVDRRRRRKNEPDSESESDGETIGSNDTSSDEEEWETEESEEFDSEVSDEFDSDSSESSSSKKKSNKNHKSRDDDSDEEETSEEELDELKIQKIVSKMFPSKYMKDRYKRKSKESKEKKHRSSRRIKKQKKRKEAKEESESEDSDDSDYEEDYDDDEGAINIILGIRGGEEDETEELIEDENEECDSDDEEMFVKETYQKLELPEETKSEDKVASKYKKGKKYNKGNKSKNKTNDSTESEEQNADELQTKFDSEYNDLVDMKKYLTHKLHEKPKSKTLLKSLNETKDSIKKLIKKTRSRNTKSYHRLINSHKQKMTNEVEYFKRKLSNKEQLRVMQDLKEVNEQMKINVPYRVALLDSQIPNKYKSVVMQKLNILKSMDPSDNEYYKIKHWVDAFMRIPFGKYKDFSMKMSDGVEKCSEFMDNAVQQLDGCVYGLNDAKMQILQMIGQWISNPTALGSAIAVKGPPGTGKTSLIKEGISKILGREFSFIALGGASDSSFLEGHSYTYEGSVWGKIVQILMDSKSMNPVIYFDELDKVSDTPKGEEIIGILTHLTDTTQNSAFHDKYFSDIDFDLSKCLFIFSYNDESKVNPILKDRMYRIETKGYGTKDKVTIAKQYLLPKIREQVSFSAEDVVIPDETIEYIINNRGMTQGEEGVRNLKRCLEVIHTKLNLFRLVKPNVDSMISKEIKLDVKFPFTVGKSDVDALIKSEEGLSQSMLALYI